MTATAVATNASVEWTPDLLEKVREWRDAKMPSTAIAERLGTTRNAVLGAARRHKLPSVGTQHLYAIKWTRETIERAESMWIAGSPTGEIAAAVGCTKNAVWAAAIRYVFPKRALAYPTQRRAPKLRGSVDPVIDQEIPVEQRKTFLELEAHHCRWPVGEVGTDDFFFCGAEPLEGRSYCAAHHARAHEYVREKR